MKVPCDKHLWEPVLVQRKSWRQKLVRKSYLLLSQRTSLDTIKYNQPENVFRSHIYCNIIVYTQYCNEHDHVNNVKCEIYNTDVGNNFLTVQYTAYIKAYIILSRPLYFFGNHRAFFSNNSLKSHQPWCQMKALVLYFQWYPWIWDLDFNWPRYARKTWQ